MQHPPPGQPPTGRVALVFTDVEGSTELWEHAPDAMRAGLTLHDACMRAQIARHRGYEVKTEGDAFMVAFGDPADAVRWCLDTQQVLLDLPWPASLAAQTKAEPRGRGPDGRPLFQGLRIRMGGHLGEPDCRPDPVTGRMDYFGPVVNRSARIGGSGHGGQVVVSRALWDAARAADPALDAGDALARPLGTFALKGLARGEELVELRAPRLADRRFPPLKVPGPRRTNLGNRVPELLGRAGELARLDSELAGGARLATLVGPGGIGKTSLALGHAALALDGPAGAAGGVWFCELAGARDADDLVREVAGVLGFPLDRGDTAAEAAGFLGRWLAGQGPCLLVLDNLEQAIAPAAALVAGWLRDCPAARWLATSREALGLADERVVEVQPLLPADGLRLFAERARAADPDFRLDEASRRASEEIVARLDGVPLAIELAAARARLLPPATLVGRLAGSMEILRSARRDLPARQRTVPAAIAWSWSLLEPAEAEALAQASAFRGGFELAAAEAVLRLPAGATAADALERLQRKSLLRLREGRLSLFEAVRGFAAGKLAAAGPGAEREVAARHADAFLASAESWCGTDPLHAKAGGDQIALLARELENLLAARAFLLGADPAKAARLTLALEPWIGARAAPGQRRAWHDEAVEAARRADDPRLLARTLTIRASGAWQAGRGEAAARDLDETLALLAARAPGADPEASHALALSALLAVPLASTRVGAEARYAEALARAEACGDPVLQAHALTGQGFLEYRRGRFVEAAARFTEAVRRCRAAGALREELALGFLGACRWNLGEPDAARSCYQRALDLAERAGSRLVEAMVLQWLGILEAGCGAAAPAREHLERAVEVSRTSGLGQTLMGSLGFLAALELEAGTPTRARAPLEEAIALATEAGDTVQQTLLRFELGALEALEDRLEAAEAACAAGRALHPAARLESLGVGLWEGQLDLARARQSRQAGTPGEEARHLAAARARLAAPGAPVPARSAARRLLERGLSAHAAAAVPAAR